MKKDKYIIGSDPFFNDGNIEGVRHLDYFLIRCDGEPLYKRGHLEWTDETKTSVTFVENENS